MTSREIRRTTSHSPFPILPRALMLRALPGEQTVIVGYPGVSFPPGKRSSEFFSERLPPSFLAALPFSLMS